MHQRFLFSLGRSFASVVALFAALAVGCARDSTVRDLGTRAVVIGVDGADWKIIDALVAEGELPNFEHLRRQGVCTNSWPSSKLTIAPTNPTMRSTPGESDPPSKPSARSRGQKPSSQRSQ